jgi:hypothetical protein
MLKKAPGFVLASLRASTYRKEYASALHLLRPRRTAFLNILCAVLVSFVLSCCYLVLQVKDSF